MTRRSFRLAGGAALTASLVLAMVALLAGPVDAHEGEAIIEIDQEHPGATSAHYFVKVTWEDDGHPVADGTVTATAVSPDGAEQTPVTLNMYDADEGLYEGTVEMPEEGTWTVRFTSVDPPGTLEYTQEVAGAAPETPQTERAPEDGEDEGVVAGDDGATELEATPVTDESSGPSILILVLVFLVLATAAAGIYLLMTRRAQTADTADAGDGEGPDEPEQITGTVATTVATTADTGSAAEGAETGDGDPSTP